MAKSNRLHLCLLVIFIVSSVPSSSAASSSLSSSSSVSRPAKTQVNHFSLYKERLSYLKNNSHETLDKTEDYLTFELVIRRFKLLAIRDKRDI